MYRVNNEADPTGTCLRGYIRASYKDLEKVLGKPVEMMTRYRGSKTIFEWRLEGPDGVVAIYDYKATDVYDTGLPTVEEFMDSIYNWHVGGHKVNAEDLATWLNSLGIEAKGSRYGF